MKKEAETEVDYVHHVIEEVKVEGWSSHFSNRSISITMSAFQLASIALFVCALHF